MLEHVQYVYCVRNIRWRVTGKALTTQYEYLYISPFNVFKYIVMK